MDIAQEMYVDNDDSDLLKKVKAGDESWVYYCDIEIKAQLSQWQRAEEPTPLGRKTRSNVKSLLIVLFDCNGVVQYELLPESQTINKEYYLEVMCRLREAIRQKRIKLWKNQSWILHHDKAPPHTSFLAKNKTVIMPQIPYSSDLAPADIFHFPVPSLSVIETWPLT